MLWNEGLFVRHADKTHHTLASRAGRISYLHQCVQNVVGRRVAERLSRPGRTEVEGR